METISTQIYRAYDKKTGDTLAVGNFGKVYEAVYGAYNVTGNMTQAEREAFGEGKEYEKLFDLEEDYSNSSNVREYFENAIRALNDNDGLDDRDEQDRQTEAVDNAISVYTFDIMECATQDISLANQTSELAPENATPFTILQAVIFEVVSEAVSAYRSTLEEINK